MNRYLIIISVMFVAVLEVLDMTIVNVALPDMMGNLGANVTQITWILTSYTLAAAIFIPLTGLLSKIFGMKNLLLINVTGFGICSTICGITPNLEVLVFGRFLQGIFGAALVPLSQTIVRNTFPQEEQAKAMAIWGMGIMVAPVFGPPVGGFIINNLDWRWIFFINIPFCILSFFLITKLIKPVPKEKVKIDFLGLVLMSISVISLQLMLDNGNDHDWLQSKFIQICLVLCILGFTVFIIRGLKVKNNIINIKIFGNYCFTTACLALSIFSAAIFACLTLFPLYLQSMLGYTAYQSGMISAPMGIASAFGMILVSKLSGIIGTKRCVLIGVSFSIIATYLCRYFTLNIDLGYISLSLVLLGFGMGMFFVPLSTLSFQTIPKEQSTEASGLYVFCRNIGSAIGIALSATLLSRNKQQMWHTLGEHINAYNPNLQIWLEKTHMSLDNPKTYALLQYQLITQSQIVALEEVFFSLFIAMICLLPIIFFIEDKP